MCGIVGLIDRRASIDRGLFNAMRDTLAHRGPDGYDSWFDEQHKVALGHRRLSILDLSEAGRQPMTNEDGTLWLTFNGEIYNFGLLREELLRRGHIFRSRTDSEVLLHGYEEWGGPGLLERLKGMFAFAIYDATRRELFVARDRFGIKPLIYFHSEDLFVFGSELKAVVRHPDVPRQIRQEALADYFLYSFVPHPKTVYEGVLKLPPATYLVVNADTGKTTTRRYWHAEPGYRKLSPSEVHEKAEDLLQTSVREHLVSDVPVGVFLSGGYDSSAILLHTRRAGVQPDSFSLGFADSERSEHHAAGEIAAALGSRHHEKVLKRERDLFPLIEELVRQYDEPFAVSSQLTYYHVCELAARTHKVVLSGDGGDELMAGYTWYARFWKERFWWRRWASAMLGRRSLREQFLRAYSRSQTGILRLLQKRSVEDPLNPDLRRLMEDRAFDYFDEHFGSVFQLIKSTQLLDIDTFLLDNSLQRADLSSMMHSLEVRVPFLDHELFEFLYSLHPSLYFDPDKNKKLIRRQLESQLPRSILDRPKHGFGFQHRDVLRSRPYMDFINNGELRSRNIITAPVRGDRITGEIAFHLIFLEQWFRTHVS